MNIGKTTLANIIQYSAAQYATGWSSGESSTGVRAFTGECVEFAEEGFDDGRSHKKGGLAATPASIVGRGGDEYDHIRHAKLTLLRIYRECVERTNPIVGAAGVTQEIYRTAADLAERVRDGDIPSQFLPFPEKPAPEVPPGEPTNPGLPFNPFGR